MLSKIPNVRVTAARSSCIATVSIARKRCKSEKTDNIHSTPNLAPPCRYSAVIAAWFRYSGGLVYGVEVVLVPNLLDIPVHKGLVFLRFEPPAVRPQPREGDLGVTRSSLGFREVFLHHCVLPA